MHVHTRTKGALTVPVAIIVAGVIIAAAVIASGRNTPTTPVAEAFFDAFAEQNNIDADDLASCINNPEITERVQADLSEAVASGGTGTPFSAIITPDGSIYPIFGGALPLESWQELLALARSGQPLVNSTIDPTGFRLPDSSDHIRGNPDAPITIVEYSDYECPFCGRLHPILRALVDTNDDVKWVYRNFPLTSIHSQAAAAALVGECIADLAGNDVFWQYTDFIYQDTRQLQQKPYRG